MDWCQRGFQESVQCELGASADQSAATEEPTTKPTRHTRDQIIRSYRIVEAEDFYPVVQLIRQEKRIPEVCRVVVVMPPK